MLLWQLLEVCETMESDAVRDDIRPEEAERINRYRSAMVAAMARFAQGEGHGPDDRSE